MIQHEKIKALNGENQVVGNFIEWLNSQGFWICEHVEKEGWGSARYYPVHKSTEQILADYYDIDLKALSAEKDQLVSEMMEALA